MKRETVAIVRNGHIQLPPGVVLPEGTAVHLAWEEAVDTLPDEVDDAKHDPVVEGIARATLLGSGDWD